MDKGPEQTFSKDSTQMVKKYMKRCLTSTNHHRKANQKLNDVSRHACLNDYYQNKDREQMLAL